MELLIQVLDDEGADLEAWLRRDSDLNDVELHALHGRSGDMSVAEFFQAMVQDNGVGLTSLLVSIGAWVDARRMGRPGERVSRSSTAPAPRHSPGSVLIRHGDTEVVMSAGTDEQIRAVMDALLGRPVRQAGDE